MRKLIALTPAQITFIRMAVDGAVEFREDRGLSGQARGAELRVANGIADAIANPIEFSELLSGARAAETFIRTFEADWSTLTDDEQGEYPGAKILGRLRFVISKFEGRL